MTVELSKDDGGERRLLVCLLDFGSSSKEQMTCTVFVI